MAGIAGAEAEEVCPTDTRALQTGMAELPGGVPLEGCSAWAPSPGGQSSLAM